MRNDKGGKARPAYVDYRSPGARSSLSRAERLAWAGRAIWAIGMVVQLLLFAFMLYGPGPHWSSWNAALFPWQVTSIGTALSAVAWLSPAPPRRLVPFILAAVISAGTLVLAWLTPYANV